MIRTKLSLWWTPSWASLLAFGLFGCASMAPNSSDRDKAQLHLQVAAEKFTQREYNASLEAAQLAVRTDPTYAAAHNQIALVYLETKRYKKSEEAFQKALELEKNYPEVWNNLGVLFNRQERFRDAIPYFEKAASAEGYGNPENALTNAGYAWYRLGDIGKAKMEHQKALDIAPQFCLANKNLGDVYAKEKNYRKAADYFQKAATNCPLFQESEFKLGLVWMKMGDRTKARSRLEKLVERHKSGPFVERSNEVLKYLR